MPARPDGDITEAQQLEFVAKRINDLLAEALPGRHLGFMSFVYDVEPGPDQGKYLAYLASNRRVDAFRTIAEWMEKTVEAFSRADLIEILRQLEQEV